MCGDVSVHPDQLEFFKAASLLTVEKDNLPEGQIHKMVWELHRQDSHLPRGSHEGPQI